MISKKNKIKAVLVTPSQFEKRFLDFQAEEKKGALLKTIKELRRPRKGKKTSLQSLRILRGYPS